MCGRLFQSLPLHRLLAMSRCRTVQNGDKYRPSFNMGPKTFLPVIRASMLYGDSMGAANGVIGESYSDNPINNAYSNNMSQQCQTSANSAPYLHPSLFLDFLPWGHTSRSNFLINARSEQLGMKKNFVQYLNENRCVVLAEGYYEWKDKGKGYLIRREGTWTETQQNQSTISNTMELEKNNTNTVEPVVKIEATAETTQNTNLTQGSKQLDTQPKIENSDGVDHKDAFPPIFMACFYSETQQVIILTRDAHPELRHIHHRMPILLYGHQEVEMWLKGSPQIIKKILHRKPDQAIHVVQKIEQKIKRQPNDNNSHAQGGGNKVTQNSQAGLNQTSQPINTHNQPVSRPYRLLTQAVAPHVNSIQEKSSKCIMTIEEYQKNLKQRGIMRFFTKGPEKNNKGPQQINKESHQTDKISQQANNNVVPAGGITISNRNATSAQLNEIPPKKNILDINQSIGGQKQSQ